jgi:FtsP/CotA-like multicopper oxidase with cupredoxin domain
MDRREFLNIMLADAAFAVVSAAVAPLTSLADEATGKMAPATGATPPTDVNSAPQRLRIVERTLEINGRPAKVFGIVRPDGGAGLTVDAGSTFDAELTSAIADPTLIHWHGLTPPRAMDGVPDNPAAALKPAETRRYSFPVGAGGTHWMHAHTLQEQKLLAAPLIVRTDEDRRRDEQEVVILLHDFTFKSPEEVLAGLKGGASAAPMKHGAGGMPMGQGGMMGTMMNGSMAGMMKKGAVPGTRGGMMPKMGTMDVNDVEFDAYLANDRTLDDPQVVAVDKGGRVRLRIINGATATAFTIDTGALGGELIAVDGQPIAPLKRSRYPIAMGQRLDIRLQLPAAGGAFPILALREGAKDRAGVVLASAGAKVARIPVLGAAAGSRLSLDLESGLRAANPLAMRPAEHHFDVTLAGGMNGYAWAIVGGDGLKVKQGERVEITMLNMSMMSHPMHLHGHHFQVVAIDGAPVAGAVRDTVHLPHMANVTVTVAFDAINPGKWPFHCHQLYHMASGMMAFVTYDGVA